MAMPAPPRAHELLEREEELAGLRDLLRDAADGRGRVLAVEGPPGIGKTRLLQAAAGEARDAGFAVLAASGSELERDFGFGVARQLFERALAGLDERERDGVLDGAAALARPALGLDAGAPAGRAPGGEAGHAVVHGLYWLTVNLAARGALLITVDDLPLADPPSLRFLGYLARRLDGLRAGIAVAMRPALPGQDAALVDAVLAGAGTPVWPGPLGERAVAVLARRELGAEPDPAFVGACHRATGGNALLVGEVLSELRRRGAAPDARTARSVQAMGTERMARAVRRRIDALAPGADRLTRAVGVLGDGCAPGLAAALAGLTEDEAVRAAADLAAADVLADAGELAFRHPVVRAAVVDRIPAAELSAAHGAAARLLAERGASAAAVAAHLRHAPPAADPRAVEHLRAAAIQARTQGLPEVAAAHLRRALAEPPVAAERAGVLRELGSAEIAAELPQGPDRLAEALELLRDPRERAEVALELAGALFDQLRVPEAAAVARGALAGLGDADRETALLLETLVAECVRMDLGVSGDEVERLQARAATLRGDTPAERFALAVSAMMRGSDTAEDHAAAAALIDRAVAAGPLPPGSPETGIVSNLIRAGRLEAAERYVERSVAHARRHGLVRSYGLMVGMRGWIELERGALEAAEADLRTATDTGEEHPAPSAGPMGALLAVVLAEQGRLAEAGDVLARFGLEGAVPEHQVMKIVLLARARVRAAQGRRAEALADALELGRRYERWNLRRAVPAWRSLAAVLLLMDGPPEEARTLAREELDLAHRWGTPQVIGVAQRAVALVDGDEDLLAAAAATLSRSPARLELARTLVELGAMLRRRRRRTEARLPLRRALELADACGAVPLAARARDELVASGARPRRAALSGPASLTVSERRVADLAARGLTNRGIAQELFVTPATVETHLRHAFQKLDIAGRGELAAALSGPPR